MKLITLSVITTVLVVLQTPNVCQSLEYFPKQGTGNYNSALSSCNQDNQVPAFPYDETALDGFFNSYGAAYLSSCFWIGMEYDENSERFIYWYDKSVVPDDTFREFWMSDEPDCHRDDNYLIDSSCKRKKELCVVLDLTSYIPGMGIYNLFRTEYCQVNACHALCVDKPSIAPSLSMASNPPMSMPLGDSVIWQTSTGYDETVLMSSSVFLDMWTDDNWFVSTDDYEASFDLVSPTSFDNALGGASSMSSSTNTDSLSSTTSTSSSTTHKSSSVYASRSASTSSENTILSSSKSTDISDSSLTSVFIDTWTDKNWFVSTADYEGPSDFVDASFDLVIPTSFDNALGITSSMSSLTRTDSSSSFTSSSTHHKSSSVFVSTSTSTESTDLSSSKSTDISDSPSTSLTRNATKSTSILDTLIAPTSTWSVTPSTVANSYLASSATLSLPPNILESWEGIVPTTYHFINTNDVHYNYSKSQQLCKAKGMKLPIFREELEFLHYKEYLVHLYQSGIRQIGMWIGLKWNIQLQQHEWEDQSVVTWTNWFTNQPKCMSSPLSTQTCEGYDCVVVSTSSKFTTRECWRRKFVICQNDNSQPQPRPRVLNCKCPKRNLNTKWHYLDGANITDAEVNEIAEEDFKKNVKGNISLSEKQVSEIKLRRKVCAEDNRPEAKGIGYAATLLISIPLALIVIPDLIQLTKFFVKKFKEFYRK